MGNWVEGGSPCGSPGLNPVIHGVQWPGGLAARWQKLFLHLQTIASRGLGDYKHPQKHP